MFSKTGTPQRPGAEAPTAATNAPAPTPSAQAKAADQPRSVPSIISQDLTIMGDLISKGELQVDGSVQGDIKGTSIVLGPSGAVSGNVVAEKVRVAGKVDGTIDAAKVELDQSAKVSGDVRHEILSISAGAHLVGKVLRRDSSAALSGAKPHAEMAPPGTRPSAPAPESGDAKGGDVKGSDAKSPAQPSDTLATR
jgi:cytoskeletal protein CcmA (bactofilin family)